jgi:nucleoid-associated protein YgaU
MFAGSFLARALLRAVILAAVALVLWSVLARPSGAHGPRVVYRVKAYDTLWTIAQSHYGGDVRDVVWQIQQANHLSGTTLVPGEKLILP